MSHKLTPQGDGDIFALDIGTRNVVGMLIHLNEDKCTVEAAVSLPHSGRSMSDGQIEDIALTAKTVAAVRSELEAQTGIAFTRVAIAAAGRALVTRRTTASQKVEAGVPVSAAAVHALELEAVAVAQDGLTDDDADSSRAYYCVGHTVVNYYLDDYKISTLEGHKGSEISVDLIAAFLPGVVVESLYAVVDRCGLTPYSMTLEPIAAMNVIIPPELRLINIALADIGAGTSDIALSDSGSIIGYAMATTAGDEITEEIIRQYLVDFDTAERMKLSVSAEEIAYTDILGFDHTISGEDLADSLDDAVTALSKAISSEILKANGKSPAAVLLVGGGSLIPGICAKCAEILDIPEERVAVGGKNIRRKIELPGFDTLPPELVTPVGIGITAGMHQGYDFSVITLNSRRVRIFDTKKVSCAQMLLQAGFKTPQIIGKTGRGLSFTLNGERRNIRGETGSPAQITVNGESVSLDHMVKPGDNITFVPAISGKNAQLSISEVTNGSVGHIFIDGQEFPFGSVPEVNGKEVSGDYLIQNFDEVTVTQVDNAGRMCSLIGAAALYRDGRRMLPLDTFVDGEYLTTEQEEQAQTVPDTEKEPESEPTAEQQVTAQPAKTAPQKQDLVKTEAAPAYDPTPAGFTGAITVILNGAPTRLEPRKDTMPHTFLELMALADIDMNAAPPSGNMILDLNGKNASFMDPLNEGDVIIIKWADK